jgi:hypothetical protein
MGCQDGGALSRQDISRKLRLTAVALGCAGVKELAARFHAANPRTHFQIERAQKWYQGRALPRSRELYDDWAKVLGIGRSGAWLETATPEAFAAEVAGVCQVPAETLLQCAGAQASAELPPPAHPGGGLSYVAGSYACYSAAWSPYYRGRIIRGAMQLRWDGGAAGALAAEYTEALLGRRVTFRGEMFAVGRLLHFDLREEADGVPLFGSFILPGSPASALCGMLAGATMIGPDPQPSAARMIMVRVPARPEASNRYLEPDDTIARDLVALGIDVPDDAEAVLQEVLRRSAAAVEQVTVADHGRLAAVFDVLHLRINEPALLAGGS